MARHRLLSPLFLTATLAASPLAAQSVLERTPNLDGAWTGLPGSAYVTGAHRFVESGLLAADRGLIATATYDAAFSLPASVLAGLRYAPVGEDEIEPYLRWTPLHEGTAPLELGATVGYNDGSIDGAVSAARWVGPLRILAEGRVLSDPLEDGTELAAGGGAVLHVLSGRFPIALAGDWVTLLDAPDGVEAAWSAGLQIGIPFTQHTVSLQASNTATTTLQGRSFGIDEIFYGFELTIPLGIGSLFGMNAPREEATHVGHEQPTGPAAAHARIARYAFMPQIIEIRAGEIVEWTNEDAMMHTVNAEDHAWHSGAIQPGASWRAQFDHPGRYPYFCGPHPFMKGMVIVR